MCAGFVSSNLLKVFVLFVQINRFGSLPIFEIVDKLVHHVHCFCGNLIGIYQDPWILWCRVARIALRQFIPELSDVFKDGVAFHIGKVVIIPGCI